MAEREKIISAQVNDTYFPVVDGVVRTVHNYASIMNGISGSYVVCPDQKGRFDDSALPYDVIRSVSLKVPFMNYALAMPADPLTVKKICARKDTSIIHAHSPFMLANSALAAAKKLNVPFVATFHSKYYDDVLQVTRSRAAARLVTSMIVNFYNKCDSVWACSESTAQTLRSYGYKKEITVMPNGTDMKAPEDLPGIVRKAEESFGLIKSRKTLLFVGSLVWQKNIKLVLDAFRLICKKHPEEYRLVIAGSGNHEREIKSYAGMLGFTKEQLAFFSRTGDRELLAGLYAAADLLFFPSVYDNAPLVLREAAAMGTPALLAEGSNSAEAVISGENGYTAPADMISMARKIVQIFEDPEALKEAGRKAKETIPVPWEDIIPDVYEKYDEIICRHKK